MYKILINSFLIIFIVTSSAVCLEEDLKGCIEDMDRLGEAVRAAIKTAEDVESFYEELESKKDELKDCVDNPDVMSPTWDNCKSIRADCKFLEKTYKEKLKNLESAFKKIANEINSVEWSCGVQFNNGSFNRSKNTIKVNCEIFKSLKEKIPIKELLDLCKKSMSEEECRECLEIE